MGTLGHLDLNLTFGGGMEENPSPRSIHWKDFQLNHASSRPHSVNWSSFEPLQLRTTTFDKVTVTRTLCNENLISHSLSNLPIQQQQQQQSNQQNQQTMATAATQRSVPSYERVEPGSVNISYLDLTKYKTVKPENFEKGTEEWVNSFNKLISSSDFSALDDLFLPESFWRDHLCLSWDTRTFSGPKKMKEFLKTGCRLRSIAIDSSTDFRKPTITGFDGQGNIQGVQTFLTVESDVGRGMGVARLVQSEGKLKAFTLFTSMRELRGHEEAVNGRRPEGVAHGGQPGRKNWLERRVADENYESSEPTVLILGR